ncbi:MAG: ferritin family protein [bacterium]
MDDLQLALGTAIKMEKTGCDLYMKTAQKTLNKLGRSTLEAIAAKELDHIKAIEEFAENNIGNAIESIKPQSKSEYIRPIMDKFAKYLDENITKDADIEKAYKAAMGLEKSSYAFYKDLFTGSTDPQAKKFFEFLMGEEGIHYELLAETLEYLNNPKDWYREKEKWIVEGG